MIDTTQPDSQKPDLSEPIAVADDFESNFPQCKICGFIAEMYFGELQCCQHQQDERDAEKEGIQ